jgi:hypothetical protein
VRLNDVQDLDVQNPKEALDFRAEAKPTTRVDDRILSSLPHNGGRSEVQAEPIPAPIHESQTP